MREPLTTPLAEALRLTRAGRLGEATAAIQRALRGTTQAPPPDDRTTDGTVEAPYRVVSADAVPAGALPPGPMEPRWSSTPRGGPDALELRREEHLRPGAGGLTSGAGKLAEASPGVPTGVPLIVFHGDRDATVHPRNGEHALAQAAPSPVDRPDHRATARRWC